jgi:hypothetical protein
MALEFVSRHVKRKPTGRHAIGLCPFHDLYDDFEVLYRAASGA